MMSFHCVRVWTVEGLEVKLGRGQSTGASWPRDVGTSKAGANHGAVRSARKKLQPRCGKLHATTSTMAALQVPEIAANGPVAKRQKVQASNGKSDATVARKSKIFAPFRVCSPANMLRGYDADSCRR
jgi:hypothetical protein